jgi:hypothetical protein
MAEAAQAGQATVRVLPANALIEGFSLPDSSFSIYSYPDPGDPRVAAVEMATTDLVITDQDQTVRYVELYDRLSRAALQPEDSITYLIKAAETLPDHHKDQA